MAAVSCASFSRGPHAASNQINSQAVAAPGSAADATSKATAQQAKLHYVEIGPSLKGDYKFGYDTGSGPAGQSFREETRLDDGTVKGAYGYIDANGKQRIVKYTAGKNGFVVEGDQEAPGQGGSSAATQAPEQTRRPQPVSAPQPQQLPQSAQPSFDEAPAVINRTPAPTAEDRARAEQQHAEQLRQHQLAQQAALAQQQQFAQRLQLQQQQQLAVEQPRRQQQQFGPTVPQPAHHHHHAHQHQQPQSPVHQQVDPQTGSFFSSSSDPNLQQLLNNQLRQLQSGSQFSGQFQPPQAPSPQQHEPQFSAQAAPAFQQAAPQFAAAPQQPPQDFGQFRAARQAAGVPQFHNQHQQPQQQQHAGVPQSALLALHQQQQHDAQLLANLRAQQLARAQDQARHQAPQQQAPPQFSSIVEVPQQQQPRQQQQQFASPQQLQRAAPQLQQPQPLANGPVNAQSVAPQQESFGPPVIDIRTLNYSIGQQTRV